VLALLVTDSHRWPLAARAGLAFATGMTVLAVVLLAASLAGLPVRPWVGLLTLLVIVGAAVYFRRERVTRWCALQSNVAQPSAPTGPRWLDWILAAAIFVSLVTVATTALLEPLVEWDVLAIWAYKAKIFARESIATTTYLTDISKGYSHLDYPVLWPFAMSWVWSFTGITELAAIKLLSVALLLALISSFYGLLAMSVDRTTALLFTALLASIPMVQNLTIRMGADVPLSLFLMISVAAIADWFEHGLASRLKLAGLAGTGLLLTKNEGMAIFAIIVATTVATLVLTRRVQSWRPVVGWLLALPALLSAPWFLLRTTIPKVHENMAAQMYPSIAIQNLDRLPQIAALTPRYLGSYEDWLWVWVLIPLVLVLGWRSYARPAIAFLAVVPQLILLLYGYVYLVTPWDPATLIEVSLSRLAAHVAPLEIFLVAMIVGISGWLPWQNS